MLVASLAIAKKGKQSKCLQKSKMCYIHSTEIIQPYKGNADTGYNMDKPEDIMPSEITQ